MARLYADEDFDLRVVIELRRYGHDVLTVQEAGQGNQRIGDAEVLAFAIDQGRVLLTFNRRDFINLHRIDGRQRHPGLYPRSRFGRAGLPHRSRDFFALTPGRPTDPDLATGSPVTLRRVGDEKENRDVKRILLGIDSGFG